MSAERWSQVSLACAAPFSSADVPAVSANVGLRVRLREIVRRHLKNNMVLQELDYQPGDT